MSCLGEVYGNASSIHHFGQQARQRLKFVKPGEKSYTVLDPEPDAGNRDPLAAIASSDEELPWYQGVWESARTADAPGARR